MNKVDLLAQVVDNAMDFLRQSIREFEKQPKYSVIHFQAAVELFLKARLMAEHWSLVMADRTRSDWDAFAAGDFTSVTLEEAAGKLKNIVGSGLGVRDLEAFKTVARHRNKMVHFFHDAVSRDKADPLRRAIAKEQLTAWYYLHRVLTSEWSDVFSKWSKKIRKIDRRLRRLRDFLRVVFDQVTPEIEKRRGDGSDFEDCPSCEFASQEHSRVIGTLYRSDCLVCGLAEKCLTIKCTKCRSPVRFKGEGFGKCGKCGLSFAPEDVVSALMDAGVACVDKVDEGYWPAPGNCDTCDGHHTVARLNDVGDRYICTSCFGEFDSVDSCGWCGELNTGDMTESSWAGCNVCDGMRPG